MGFLRSKRVVGLDIDTAEIRGVELSGSAQAPKLVACGRVPLPGESVYEGMIADPGLVEEALGHLWSDAGFTCRDVLLGVSNQGVLVRFATFPKVAPNKVDKLIRFQAQEHIPFPLDSVVLDYMIVGETAGESGDSLEVLLVAAKRDMLNIFLEVLSGAHLRVKDVDVTSLALQRVLPAATVKGAVALVNISNELSNLLVVEDNKTRFARILPTGLQSAADFFNCSLNEVVSTGMKRPDWPDDAVSEWSASLAGDINSSLSYYQTQQKGAAVEKLFLCGRGSRIEGLARKLKDNLGLPVAIIQPLDGIAAVDKKPGISRVAADFAISVALARRGLEV